MTRFTIAHSPDSDDAYMMAPLALGWMDGDEDRQGFQFEFIRKDIEQLNQEAESGLYHVTAISFGAYPGLCDRYALLSAGSSIQEGTGPLVVSKSPLTPGNLDKVRIAIPGLRTSAFLALRRYMEPNLFRVDRLDALDESKTNNNSGEARPMSPLTPAKKASKACLFGHKVNDYSHPKDIPLSFEVIPFDEILPAVAAGRFEAGLLIHESQLQYQEAGLHLVLDLGQWWKEAFDLPLPMGGNAIRKDLDRDIQLKFARLMKKSVRMARERHWESVDYAQSFGRGMDKEMVSRYVQAWVNDFTEDPGERGRLAVEKLLGLTPEWVNG